MKKLYTHISHILTLISACRNAGMSLADIARVLLADYRSRIGAGPKEFIISVDGMRLAIRSNPVDHRIALEVLGGIYAVSPTMPVSRILDLGANIGASALYLQRQFPEAAIACVEPSPGNLAMLKKNQSLNALSLTIFECAVGAEPGTTTLYDTVDPSCCTLLPRSGDGTTEVVVSTKTVPEIMTCLGWANIDLLKVDIEGYEKVILANSPEWLSRVSSIVGEIHEGYSVEQLKHDLAPFSFDVSISSPPNQHGQATFVAMAAPT